MSRNRRGRDSGGEGAPVELRFVDMFMAAIGALIFMAMLLAYVMRDLGAKEAEAKTGKTELQILAYIQDSSGKDIISGNSTDDLDGILGVFFIKAKVQTANGAQKMFDPSAPQPLGFEPKELLDNQTNSASQIQFQGNCVAAGDESKEIPFALITLPNPRLGEYKFDFAVGRTVKELGQTTNEVQIRILAKYFGFGPEKQIATNSPPLKPDYLLLHPQSINNPNFSIQVKLTADQTLDFLH